MAKKITLQISTLGKLLLALENTLLFEHNLKLVLNV